MYVELVGTMHSRIHKRYEMHDIVHEYMKAEWSTVVRLGAGTRGIREEYEV